MKLFITYGHPVAVDHAIARESCVDASPLTDLEASVRLGGIYLGGIMSSAQFERTHGRLAGTFADYPFMKRPLVNRIFSAAITQHAESAIHCSSLDRLHLAAMAQLGVSRLMTHDTCQAEGARELEFEVVMPGGI